MFLREQTKKVMVGGVQVGGGSHVSIQSMLSVPAADFDGNVKQALRLQQAGCEIVRVSVPDMNTVPLIAKLKENLEIPVDRKSVV